MGAIQNSINSMIGSAAIAIGAGKKIGSDVKKNQAETKKLNAEADAQTTRAAVETAKFMGELQKQNKVIPGYDVEMMMKATDSAQKNLEVKKAQKQAFKSLLDLI